MEFRFFKRCWLSMVTFPCGKAWFTFIWKSLSVTEMWASLIQFHELTNVLGGQREDWVTTVSSIANVKWRHDEILSDIICGLSISWSEGMMMFREKENVSNHVWVWIGMEPWRGQRCGIEQLKWNANIRFLHVDIKEIQHWTKIKGNSKKSVFQLITAPFSF